MLDSFMQMGFGTTLFLSVVVVCLTVIAVVMLVPFNERLRLRMGYDKEARDRDRLAAIARSEHVEAVPHRRNKS